MSRFLVGCDLGQMSDYTALSVIEAAAAIEADGTPATAQHCRHLERLRGVSYVAIAARVRDLVATLRDRTPRPTVEVVLDRTGVGAAAHDVMVAAKIDAKLVPVVIHGGDKVTVEAGVWRCPKRDLVSAVAVALQGGRFKIAAGLELREVLTAELGTFRLKHTATGHDQYEAWREDDHDDLVLSVALPLWWAARGKPRAVAATAIPQRSSWGRGGAGFGQPIRSRGF